MSVIRSAVTGVGSYLPEQIVTNADLAKIVDTSDEWIVQRTGIRQRRLHGAEIGEELLGRPVVLVVAATVRRVPPGR